MSVDRKELAAQLFSGGCNCAQAVLGAYCEDGGLPLDTALRLAGGLGSGARNAALCGAVTGAILVIGLRYGQDKERCNLATEAFTARFARANGSLGCRELLGCDIMTPSGREQAIRMNLFTARCTDLVKSAVAVLEEEVLL